MKNVFISNINVEAKEGANLYDSIMDSIEYAAKERTDIILDFNEREYVIDIGIIYDIILEHNN